MERYRVQKIPSWKCTEFGIYRVAKELQKQKEKTHISVCEALSSAEVLVRLLLLGTELRQPLLLGTGVSPPPFAIPIGAGAPRVERVPCQQDFTTGEADAQPPFAGDFHLQPPIADGIGAAMPHFELTTELTTDIISYHPSHFFHRNRKGLISHM